MGIEPDKIFVGFIVDENGKIVGQRIIRNIEKTKVAEQILNIITDTIWSLGYCNKKAVPVMMVIPIQICLR